MQRLALHVLDMYPLSATGKGAGTVSGKCGSFVAIFRPTEDAFPVAQQNPQTTARKRKEAARLSQAAPSQGRKRPRRAYDNNVAALQ